MIPQYSYPREKIRILLLENIHPAAVSVFENSGYSAETQKAACSVAELAEVISDVHVLGIRSKTTIPAELLKNARKLLAIGCFCIGTDQVDLEPASRLGIPVFNAPFSNTRSVAELTMAEIVLLARKAGDMNSRMHRGIWNKSASSCHEVRHKSLGIVGYGHIGQQVGLLAEAFGMKVYFYDILKKLPLGTAQEVGSLEELLVVSDFVTLHVPDTNETREMIGAKELSKMRKGAYLLNLSRG
ncbi:MAG: phosphoglycerate dehydrogenase, partial [Bdellovibrionales bacterium]|nr:phosphoglycerate dehydrogenase [Bdellovibrionales bacterium]